MHVPTPGIRKWEMSQTSHFRPPLEQRKQFSGQSRQSFRKVSALYVPSGQVARHWLDLYRNLKSRATTTSLQNISFPQRKGYSTFKVYSVLIQLYKQFRLSLFPFNKKKTLFTLYPIITLYEHKTPRLNCAC